jgi:hypothetical protein
LAKFDTVIGLGKLSADTESDCFNGAMNFMKLMVGPGSGVVGPELPEGVLSLEPVLLAG